MTFHHTLQNIDQTFMLVTTARAVIHDSFIDTSGSSLDTSVSNTWTMIEVVSILLVWDYEWQ